MYLSNQQVVGQNNFVKSLQNNFFKSFQNGFVKSLQNDFFKLFKNGFVKLFQNGFVKSFQNDLVKFKSFQNVKSFLSCEYTLFTRKDCISRNQFYCSASAVACNTYSQQPPQQSCSAQQTGAIGVKFLAQGNNDNNQACTTAITRLMLQPMGCCCLPLAGASA